MEPTRELKQAVVDYQNGKAEAFTTLYEESQKYVYVCIQKILKDCDNLSEAVSDVMQDTYTEISRNISQLERTESFLNWAGSITTRQCYAYLKKNRRQMLSLEEDNVLEKLAIDEELIPEAVMQDREKQRLIRKIIDTELTPMQRLCIIAFYYNEQKQSEIARDLGIPENTVKTHLSRAKAKIKEGVLRLEKKEGTKLYSVAPLLLLLLKEEIRECVVPAEITKGILAASMGSKVRMPAGSQGAAGVKGAAGKGVVTALKVKIVAAVIGACALIAVGGIVLSQSGQSSEPGRTQEKEYDSQTVLETGNENDGETNKFDSDNDGSSQSIGTDNTDDSSNSNNIFDYTLIVNDVEYIFPLSFDEMVTRGWKSYGEIIDFESTEEFGKHTIPANSSGRPFYGGLGGMSLPNIEDVSVIFDNISGTEAKQIKDCDVIGIQFENDKGIPAGSVSLKGPNGMITVGESTMDDVVAFFDGDYYYYEDDGFIYINYDEEDVISYITFTIYHR